MPRLPLDEVRWLTLREIAYEWAKEAEMPEVLMLRELRYAVVNIPRLKAGQPLVEAPLADHELPDPDQQVDWDWLIDFCGKQGWTHPGFWKGNLAEVRQFPGRPAYQHRTAIEEELERRGKEGELAPTLAAEARSLRDWAGKRFVDAKPPSALTIENACRHRYRLLQAAHINK